MQSKKSYKKVVYSSIALSLLFTGCSIKPELIKSAEIKEDVKQNIKKLNKQIVPVTKPITLDEAINRAVNHNLSKKVDILNAALTKQKIDVVAQDALPKLTAKAGYKARDSYAASASTSFDNGQPNSDWQNNPSYSISQDKTETNAGASFTWNVLDFGLSYVRAKQQSNRYLIAKEKEKKAKHNIEQQVREAYYKAVSADELLRRIQPIMKETREAINDSRNISKLKLEKPIKALSYQRELLEVLRSLHTLEENLIKSKIKLSKLMGLRPGTKFELAEKIKSEYKLPQVNVSVENLETLALENRPELQESRYKQRISKDEIKKVMLELLPGINLNAGYTYTNNEYLLNNDWTSYGASVSWNLLNVFNAGVKQKVAKTQIELAKQEKLAVSMAVISQVHMALVDYHHAKKQYQVSEDYFKIAEQIFEIIQSENNFDMNGRLSLIKEKLNYLISNLRLSSSYAKVQNAYGKLISSVGNEEVFKPKTIEKKVAKKKTTEKKTTEKKSAEEKSTEKKSSKTKETKIDKQEIKVEKEENFNSTVIKKADVIDFPNENGKTIKTLEKGTKIEVLNKVYTTTGYWYKLSNGYIKTDLVKSSVASSEHLLGIAKRNLNIRASNNLSSSILEVLKKGESIKIEKKVYSQNGTWYKTPKGYISEELLKVGLRK